MQLVEHLLLFKFNNQQRMIMGLRLPMQDKVDHHLHTIIGHRLLIRTLFLLQENNLSDAQQPYPYIANARQPSNAQQPYPYIANARQPLTYDHRSPFTYGNPVNAQQPYIANARPPSTYQNRSPFTYDHRSPFTYQLPYSTTRPISSLAKVKGVFVNDGGTLRKAQDLCE